LTESRGKDVTEAMSNKTVMSETKACRDDSDERGGYGLAKTPSSKTATTEMTQCPVDGDVLLDMDYPSESTNAAEHVEEDNARHAKESSLSSVSESSSHGTTLMIRNLPCRVTSAVLVEEIHQKGFAGRYDFVYVPPSHRPKTNLGYAFVNLMDEADEEAFKLAFDGFRFDGTTSRKVCVVQRAHHQGIVAQLNRRSKAPRDRRTCHTP